MEEHVHTQQAEISTLQVGRTACPQDPYVSNMFKLATLCHTGPSYAPQKPPPWVS